MARTIYRLLEVIVSEQFDPRQAFDAALRHHRAGQLAEAEAIYRGILAASPDHADTLHLLGVLASQRGRHNTAIELIGRAIDLKKEEPSAQYHTNMAMAYLAANLPAEAIDCLKEALNLKPRDADGHFNVAVLLTQQDRMDEAIVHYHQAIALKPDYAEAHSNLGGIFQKQRRLDEAAVAYRRALASNPGLAELHYNLAGVLQEMGLLDEAATSYRQAIALKPRDAEAHNNLGMVLKLQGKLADALALFDEALALSPHYAEAISNRGSVLLALAKIDEALACHEKALGLRSEAPELHTNYANDLLDCGRLEAAEAHFRTALALKPDFAEYHHNLGNALVALRRFNEAAESFKHALMLKPGYAEAHNNLGNVLNDLGHPEQAVAHYEHALALKPDFAGAHYNLGMFLRSQNRLDEAVKHFRRAVAVNPAYPEAIVNLGLTLLDLGRNDEAVVAAQTAERLQTRNFPHYLLGVLFARCGQVEWASAHLQAYLDSDPEDRQGARMILARLGQAPMPERASDALMANVYGRRAWSWDRAVDGPWPYRGAHLVAGALEKQLGQAVGLDILDAGCGTGFVGQLLRVRAVRLVGADLSAPMLERAAEKKIYDELHHGDLVQFMNGRPLSFDVIACAATLIHFGDLQPPFAAAADALRDGGLFALTLFPNADEENGRDFVVASMDGLAQGGCYEHSQAYIARVAEACGFTVETVETAVHEYRLGKPKDGLIIVLRRAPRVRH